MGDDLSFSGQCKNGFLTVLAFKGQGSTANSNSSNVFNKGEPKDDLSIFSSQR
jgi:hypothetical protein